MGKQDKAAGNLNAKVLKRRKIFKKPASFFFNYFIVKTSNDYIAGMAVFNSLYGSFAPS